MPIRFEYEVSISGNLYLKKNQIQDVAIHNTSTEPTVSVMGQVIYNTSSNKFGYYNSVEAKYIYPDMEKSIYDSNNNGKVDNSENSELLDGQNGDYYLNRENHTGNSSLLGGTIQNSNLSIQAKNEGSISGNPRGAGAIDLQTYRTNVAHVASGQYSVTIGSDCQSTGQMAFAFGNSCKSLGILAIALGNSHVITGNNSSGIGGFELIINGDYSSASGGYKITINSNYVGATGGRSITVQSDCDYSGYLAGYRNVMVSGSEYAVMLGGTENTIAAKNSVNLAGKNLHTDYPGEVVFGYNIFSERRQNSLLVWQAVTNDNINYTFLTLAGSVNFNLKSNHDYNLSIVITGVDATQAAIQSNELRIMIRSTSGGNHIYNAGSVDTRADGGDVFDWDVNINNLTHELELKVKNKLSNSVIYHASTIYMHTIEKSG